jgi:malate dehydrogenase
MNKKIFVGQGKALEGANENVKCVVIANPANTNAYILAKYAPEKVKK